MKANDHLEPTVFAVFGGAALALFAGGLPRLAAVLAGPFDSARSQIAMSLAFHIIFVALGGGTIVLLPSLAFLFRNIKDKEKT